MLKQIDKIPLKNIHSNASIAVSTQCNMFNAFKMFFGI